MVEELKRVIKACRKVVYRSAAQDRSAAPVMDRAERFPMMCVRHLRVRSTSVKGGEDTVRGVFRFSGLGLGGRILYYVRTSVLRSMEKKKTMYVTVFSTNSKFMPVAI
jgi:hypothetical protein